MFYLSISYNSVEDPDPSGCILNCGIRSGNSDPDLTFSFTGNSLQKVFKVIQICSYTIETNVD